MLNIKPWERQKTLGYSEMCQYFSSNLFSPNKRHLSQSNLRKKHNSCSKKYQPAPKSLKATSQHFNLSIKGRKTYDRFKTQIAVPNDPEVQRFFQNLQSTKWSYLQKRSTKEKDPIYRASKTQFLATRLSKKQTSPSIKSRQFQQAEENDRLLGKQHQKAKIHQKKYKYLNMVGNKMKFCRIDERIFPNSSLFLTSKIDRVEE